MLELRLDEITLTITTGDKDIDRVFWATKTPAERLAAMEFLRQLQYGYDPASARIQRVVTVYDRLWA